MGLTRFLLALAVVVTHSPSQQLFGAYLLNGVTAVQAFYVISGFLITMVLASKPEYASAKAFYASRYLRLWPTYAAVAAFVLVVRYDRFVLPLFDLGWAGLFIAFSSATLFLQDWSYFLNITPDNGLAWTSYYGNGRYFVTTYPVAPSWTIGVELAFYAIAPLVCRRWYTLAAVFVAGTVVRLIIGNAGVMQDPWTYRFAPAEMMLFAAGGLAFFGSRWLKPFSDRPWFRAIGWSTVGLLAVGILLRQWLLTFQAVNSQLAWFSVTLWLVDPISLGIVALACPLMFYGARHRFDSFIGELSYPMYISHFIVGGFLPFLHGHLGGLVYVAAVIAVSVGLHLKIERPMEAVRRRLAQSLAAAANVKRAERAALATV
jgi:peptidoglycan/LPS O-acetylase OafA/YrhL